MCRKKPECEATSVFARVLCLSKKLALRSVIMKKSHGERKTVSINRLLLKSLKILKALCGSTGMRAVSHRNDTVEH